MEQIVNHAPALRKMLEAVAERRRALSLASPSEMPRVISFADLANEPLLPRWRERLEYAAKDGVTTSLYASGTPSLSAALKP